MADIYIKYTPIRRGLTGAEFLAGFLDEHHPNVTWSGIISSGMAEYGKISGSGDDLTSALLNIEGRFSIAKLDETQLVGLCNMAYTPIDPPMPEDGTALTFIEFMDTHGITVTDELAAVKKGKRFLFKEGIKKFLQPNNDNISALTKAVVLHLFHYDNLSVGDKAQVDSDTTALVAIYSEAMCVSAYTDLVSELQSTLADYYSAVVSLESQTTVEDAIDVEYPSA